MDHIPTLDTLMSRNCNFGNGYCVLCRECLETVDHLFCACWVANLVWQYICIWCNACPFFVFTVKDLVEIHDNVGIWKEKKKAFKCIIMVACWCI